jgi:hypothetical protein
VTVRAKFMCSSVKLYSAAPYEVKRHTASGEEPSTRLTWPRNYEFTAVYDQNVPEDQRYCEATPSGQVTIRVDNPAVEFVPGRYYYLDFTPVEG